MSRFTASLALLVVGGTSACGGTVFPFDKDPLAVVDRYPHRIEGTCSVWLTSHISGFEYCASPKLALGLGAPVAAGPVKVVVGAASDAASASAAPTFSKSDGATDLDALSAHGKSVYDNVCTACHGPTGEGVPGAFPPLAGAGDYYGTAQNHARIIVHGLSGEIVVKGVTYNGAMPQQGTMLTDYDIAAVATYERHSWGNADGIVLPADVAAVR